MDEEVSKVVAEGENGYFGILPRHIDFVSALASGILSFEFSGREEFIAVDGGILVKCGQEVLVSTRDAVRSGNLGELQKMVEEKFQIVGDQEKKSRSALAKLETDFVRRFLEWQKNPLNYIISLRG